MKGRQKGAWLLVKKKDEAAVTEPYDSEKHLGSITKTASSGTAKITTETKVAKAKPTGAKTKQTGIMTGAVGMITTAKEAETIITTGQADIVLLARELLRDPYFPMHAALELGYDYTWPSQYERAKPRKV